MVLDAVVELHRDGVIEPSVEEVSERSGVSTRSIYRYFHHRDGVIEAALWHYVEQLRVEHPLVLNGGGLQERINEFVRHRSGAHERLAPLVRAARGVVVSGTVDSVRESEITRERRKTVFCHSVASVFADDFGRVPSAKRRLAEVAAEVMMQFESIESALALFDGDRPTMETMLSRHLLQQLRPAGGECG